MSKLNELQKKWKKWNSEKPDETQTKINLKDGWKLEINFLRETAALCKYHKENVSCPIASTTMSLEVLEKLYKELENLYK
jgi:hypothetical protein